MGQPSRFAAIVRYGFLILLGTALVLPFIAFAVNAFSRQWFHPQPGPEDLDPAGLAADTLSPFTGP